MADEIDNLNELQNKLGVKSWPELTKEQTFELLKLAGEQKLTTNVLSTVVELAPTFRELAVECFITVRESVAGMKGLQEQALAIVSKVIDAFDRCLSTLLESWKTANDPRRIAKLIEIVSRQMTEIVQIVERMNADNNRSWSNTIATVGKWFLAVVAVGASVAAAASRRN